MRLLPMCLAVSGVFVLPACMFHPPHYAGEDRPTVGPKGERPSWTGWGVKTQADYLYVVGSATHRPTRDIARSVARENVRDRLAAATMTRILSDRKLREAFHSLREQGLTGEVEPSESTEGRMRLIVHEILKDTEPADEYWEEFEVFENGWKQLVNCWVMIKISEEEYVDRLEGAIAETGAFEG